MSHRFLLVRQLVMAFVWVIGGTVIGTAQIAPDREVYVEEARLEVLMLRPAARSFVDQAPVGPHAIVLPTPEGGEDTYLLLPSRVMSAALQASYPELRTFVGFRQNHPEQRIRATYRPQAGWQIAYGGPNVSRAVVYKEAAFAKTSSSADLQPSASQAQPTYRLQFAADQAPATHSCGFAEANQPGPPLPIAYHKGEPSDDADPTRSAQSRVAPNLGPQTPDLGAQLAPNPLRRYRLALTCTGEYAQAVGGTNPTKATVLAAMVTAVNRLNEVYERDLGITFELIPRNDELIFLDGATDPYDNSDANALLSGSHTQITQRIGTEGFDLGHVFATEGAGLASLASVCTSRGKGKGTTGISNPATDFFYIDYVAHEIGHQLGATHTFYNSCSNNRENGTAFEPGSGSTIMAYAGICSPNIQNRSDDYFHAASLAQIRTVLAGSGGCAASSATDNQVPEFATTTPLADLHYIPTGTPFFLDAVATDANGDPLTYTWEQMDNIGNAPQPPVGSNVDGPLFRSLRPSPSPRRVFTTIAGQYATLPTVSRDLNFRVTVRDNRRPAGATASRDVRVRAVGGEAPFEVLNLTSNLTAQGFASQEIVYRAGRTREAPISADLVDVYLSSDGGLTYSDTLAVGVPNNGRALVTLPNLARTGRVIVRGHGKVFFAVSKGVLTVQPTTVPTLVLSGSGREIRACVGERMFRDTLRSRAVLGFSESVHIQTSALPAGIELGYVTTPQAPGFSLPIEVRIRAEAKAGEYRIGVWGIAASSTNRIGYTELTIGVTAVPSVAPLLLVPTDGSRLTQPEVAFAFEPTAGVPRSRLQVSRSPIFTRPVIDTTLELAAVTLPAIAPGIYYWRAAAINECGNGPWSVPRGFQVLDLVDTALSVATRVQISSGAAADYRLSVTVPTARPVYRYEVSTNVTHTWVGDLSGSLRLPDGTSRTLFEQAGGGDCGGSDLAVTFSDAAEATATTYTNTCGREVPSISGRFRAVSMLGTDLPKASPGTWTLTIRDNAADDGGSLDRFDLRYWVRRGTASAAAVATDTLFARTAVRTMISPAQLQVTDAGVASREVVYVLRALPRFGSLYRGNAVVGAMDTFSQASIDGGAVSYESAGAEAVDDLRLDVLVGQGEYFPNQRFTVSIGQRAGALALGVIATARPGCAEDGSGIVTLVASGGRAPYRFGVVGGPLQADANFPGLAPGTYAFRVVDALDVVRRIDYTLEALVPFVVEVAGSRVRVVPTGGTLPGGARYSFDGGVTFSADSVGYAYTGGVQRVLVEAGVCTYALEGNVTRPLKLDVTNYVFCGSGLTPIGGEACVNGGVGGFEFVVGSGGEVGAGAPSPNCDSLFTFIPVPGVSRLLVAVRDAVGAEVRDTVNVIRANEPVISLALEGERLTVGTSVGAGPYAYQLNGGVFQFDSTFNSAGQGPFDLAVRDRYGCIYEFAQVSSLRDAPGQMVWRLYPNPVRDLLTIELDDPVQVDRISLFTVTGQVVVQQRGGGRSAKTQLDVAHLAAGYYVLELRTDSGVVTRAVVVE